MKVDSMFLFNADRFNETKKHWIGIDQSFLGQKRDTDLWIRAMPIMRKLKMKKTINKSVSSIHFQI